MAKIWIKGYTKEDGTKVKGYYREQVIDPKKAKTFSYGGTRTLMTSDPAEIKKYRATGWKEVKKPKISFAKNLKGGRSFY